jgi:lipopolysaccharide transport system ATP-binding protein
MGWIRVEKLGKRYKHYARRPDRLREWATLGRHHRHEEVWVLRGVSFAVDPGEAVGVVGANGAGKSTLLKLVKRTIRPTEGTVEVLGRMAALELGLGFHPDFTGRQNLFTSGALLGLGGAQIERLVPEIEDFAEIGPYLDDPVRTYSSGMQLRLAFSLATAMRPDVLLIDEALAVGDAYFQQKCMMRIRQFRKQGTTLLLVSHDPVAMKSLCDRAVLLDQGLLVREGPPDAVLDYYNAIIAKQRADYEIRQGEELGGGKVSTRSGDGRAVIERVELSDESGPTRAFRVGAAMRIEVHGRTEKPIEDLTVGISIRDRVGNEIFGTNTHHLGIERTAIPPSATFQAIFELPANLGVGNYTLTTALHAGAVHLEGNYDWWDRVEAFQVVPGTEPFFVGSSHLPVESRVEILGAAIEPREGLA